MKPLDRKQYMSLMRYRARQVLTRFYILRRYRRKFKGDENEWDY